MGSAVRFDERYIEELKARLRPSDVIGRTVKLKRQGREFVGLSPFTKEKSPSFFVNDDKGFFHDFSSGKHGDIISFLQETERLSFVEAVQRLAGEAGMALPAEDPQAIEREQKRQGLSDWMDLAQKWFSANLRRNVGKAAREYLERRGLPEDQWERFGLGYAPNDREGLKAALVQRGAKPAELVEAGLLIAPESGGAPYDRFRDRLMFPILDARGRIVSFGGRAMNPDDRAKYLNGPESPLFHKGATLYGLPEARRILGAESRNDQPIVVVEGYMDVIACQRAGLPAVAPMGTALTEEQMERLWRVSHEPVLCFDGDGAGKRAAYRALDLALPRLAPGKSLRFALLPEGQDPDDLLRSGGREAVADVIAQAKPLADMLWQREIEPGGFDTPERRAALEARIAGALKTIGDESVRRYYRQEFEARLAAFFDIAPRRGAFAGGGPFPRWAAAEHWRRDALPGRPAGTRAGFREARGPQASPYTVLSQQLASSPVMRGHRAAMPRREALILQSVLNHPWLLHDHLEQLSSLSFRHPDAERLKGAIIDGFAQDASVQAEALRADLIRRGFADMLDRLAGAITTSSVWGVRIEAAAADVLITWQQLIALHQQWHSLAKELREAEAAFGEDASEANYAWLRDVKTRIAAIEGTEALIEGFGASSGRPVRAL